MRLPGFIGPTYVSESPNADAQRSINLYPEIVESGTGANKIVLYGTPGLATFGTLATSPVRGLFSGDNRLFAVAGTKLYEVFSSGSSTLRGDVTTDAGNSPVMMWPNGSQLLIVSAGKAFIDNGTTIVPANVPADPTASVLTPAGQVQTASSGVFIDGYYICAKPNSKYFFLSNLYDGTTWDALEFGVKQGYPDNIIRCWEHSRDLWLFGDQSIEVWRNTGAADFPFERDPGAFMQSGIIAPFCVANLPSGPAWLGGDYRGKIVAFRAQGYQMVRFSNHSVEQSWAEYAVVADAQAFVYVENGHTFLVVTFPTADKTWAYDTTTNMWHERGLWNGSAFERSLAGCYSYQFTKGLAGARNSGIIYRMATDIFTDGGVPIKRVRRAPHVNEEKKRVFYSSFTLDMETGNVADPAVTLSWSDDGGTTFNAGTTITAGASGDRKKRVIWRRLGNSRDRVFEINTQMAARVCFVDAYVDAVGGAI